MAQVGGLTYGSKWCPKCQEVTERKKAKKGLSIGECKICAKRHWYKWKANNPEKFKESNKKAKDKRKTIDADRRKERIKEGLPPEIIQKQKEYMIKYKQENKEKIKAHSQVGRAIVRGILPSPKDCICKDCGNKATEYHHEDYTKPLEVVALCKPCHWKRHHVDSSVQHPAD